MKTRNSLTDVARGGDFAGSAAAAQTFPTRTVKIAVPFPAGGGTDLLARLIADALGKKWGQTVYVENLSGAASGNVGASEVARSTPDGYTLLLSPPGPIAMNKLLYKSMPFDSSKWVPISVVASVPYVLAVRNGLGVTDVKGLIAKAKANPQDHLRVARRRHGRPSGGQAVRDAGRHQTHDRAVQGLGARAEGHRRRPRRPDLRHRHDVAAAAQSKQVKIIATGSAERWPSLPDVPTIAESGLPGFRAVTWYAIVAPPDTPAAVADKISRDVAEVVNDPASRKHPRQAADGSDRQHRAQPTSCSSTTPSCGRR